ncbi:MAG: carbohydrate-binding family 9-like protein [Armatimonadota bacterium]
MVSHSVLVLPKVTAPDMEQAFWETEHWESLPAFLLVRAADGTTPAHPTAVQAAWSDRGIHVFFTCTDPLPIPGDNAGEAPDEEGEAVGVFLDPIGEREQYVAILVSPYGRVYDARIENPLHRRVDSEIDESWDCSGIRVQSRGGADQWTVEMLIPFSGLTPALDPPKVGDRWTGNFYRIIRQPREEISAWQPTCQLPVDVHNSDAFGILEFGPELV